MVGLPGSELVESMVEERSKPHTHIEDVQIQRSLTRSITVESGSAGTFAMGSFVGPDRPRLNRFRQPTTGFSSLAFSENPQDRWQDKKDHTHNEAEDGGIRLNLAAATVTGAIQPNGSSVVMSLGPDLEVMVPKIPPYIWAFSRPTRSTGPDEEIVPHESSDPLV